VNFEILMDLRQRKENSDNGGGTSSDIGKLEKIKEVIRRKDRRVVDYRGERRGVSSDDKIQGMIFPMSGIDTC